MPVIVAPVLTPAKEPAGDVARAPDKKGKKKRKKRIRGEKPKNRAVVQTGDGPTERKLKHGKVRHLNILRKDPDDRLPRKTREMLASIAALKPEARNRRKEEAIQRNAEMIRKEKEAARGKAKGADDGKNGQNEGGGTDEPAKAKGNKKLRVAGAGGDEPVQTKGDEKVRFAGAGGDVAEKRPVAETKLAERKAANKMPLKPKFDGMQPGENFHQFSARLRRESRQMVMDTVKMNNHQRVKKRAYYEKRRLRAERRKRRRGGDRSDSDVEYEADDGDDYAQVSNLPGYWLEHLSTNGGPSRKRARKDATHDKDSVVDHVTFGEQVERPPQFSALPVRRGKDTER